MLSLGLLLFHNNSITASFPWYFLSVSLRAETLASMEQAQWASEEGDRQVSGPRAEFWKLRGLRGAKKNVRRTRDDLLQLTIQGKFPAYERVLLREGYIT